MVETAIKLPSSSTSGKPMILLSIENLSNETNVQEIERLFSSCGSISSIRLKLGAPHSRYPGSGLIGMQGNDSARVISAFDGRLFRGMVLRVTEQANREGTATSTAADAKAAVEDSEDYLHIPFRLISVEKADDPALAPTEDWYRYVIQSGKSNITGLHRGSLVEVTRFAEDCAEAFNQRNSTKGRRSITWSSRNKK